MTRAIIMCDGKSMRWYSQQYEKEWGNVKKQLVKVNEEPILHRTVRLLQEIYVSDIWITSHDPEFNLSSTKRYEPPNNEYEIDKFYACKEIWGEEETTFIYGDVFFTQNAIQRVIFLPTNDFTFYGRFHGSHFTGHGGEIFALKVKSSEYGFFSECCEYLRDKHIKEQYRCGAWELYRLMNGATDEQLGIHVPYWHFIGIDDFTDDFDTPEHYINWLKKYKGA